MLSLEIDTLPAGRIERTDRGVLRALRGDPTTPPSRLLEPARTALTGESGAPTDETTLFTLRLTATDLDLPLFRTTAVLARRTVEPPLPRTPLKVEPALLPADTALERILCALDTRDRPRALGAERLALAPGELLALRTRVGETERARRTTDFVAERVAWALELALLARLGPAEAESNPIISKAPTPATTIANRLSLGDTIVSLHLPE